MLESVEGRPLTLALARVKGLESYTHVERVIGMDIGYVPPVGLRLPEVLSDTGLLRPGEMVYGYTNLSRDPKEGSIVERAKEMEGYGRELGGIWGGVFVDQVMARARVRFEDRPVFRTLGEGFIDVGDKLVVDELSNVAYGVDGIRFLMWCYKRGVDLYVCRGPLGGRMEVPKSDQLVFIKVWMALRQMETAGRYKASREKSLSGSSLLSRVSTAGADDSSESRPQEVSTLRSRLYGWRREAYTARNGRVVYKYVACEEERRQVRELVKLRREGRKFTEIWGMYMVRGERMADGSYWARVSASGKPDLTQLVRACNWYEEMMHQTGGVEDWAGLLD